MEDVLDLYAEPYDALRPVVLHAETHDVVLPRPGRPARHDYEYRREGTANLFVAVEPLAGYRRVTPTDRRTACDYAHTLQQLVDEDYRDVDVIRLVQDNLNTHTPASL